MTFYEVMEILFPVGFLVFGVIGYLAVKNNWKIMEWMQGEKMEELIEFSFDSIKSGALYHY